MRKIWKIKERDKKQAAALAADLKISPLLAGILLNRGIDTAEKAGAFLHSENTPYHDPFLLPDMEQAADRIMQGIKEREQMVVYGDYDADGITATSVLLKTLRQLGAIAEYYIPDRFTEGYGINRGALEKLYNLGVSLVITVDCGIKSVAEIKEMQGKLDFVVTDHHLPGEELPPAVAVVDAHRRDSVYPYADLAGVGIAFKLSQALWQRRAEEKAAGMTENAEVFGHNADVSGCKAEDCLEIVALGTVADAVPLTGENRKIVAAGLKRMPETKWIGLKVLMESAGLQNRSVNSTTIGFVLAPRINAAGRLKHAGLSVDLLLSENDVRAKELAQQLCELNTSRKALKNEMQKMAEEQLKLQDMSNAKVIVVAGQEWHHGVLGLVASALQEKYYRPAIVISLKDGVGKGSCRSIPGFNLFEALTNASEALIQFGGHEMAAGLTVEEGKIPELRRLLEQEAVRQLTPRQFIPFYDIDLEISPGAMDLAMVEELSLLEPCGVQNESPVFAVRNACCLNPELKGVDAKHLKFKLQDGDKTVDAIGFYMDDKLERVSQGRVNMVYQAEINEWHDMKNVQCVVRSLEDPVPEIKPVKLDREFLKEIYLFLRHKEQLGENISTSGAWLSMELNLQGCSAGTEAVATAVEIFRELGILQPAGENMLQLNHEQKKFDLQQSAVYRKACAKK